MSKIIELPEILANQIAAGEVVERPASVVKELVENAIDAGASQIQIAIEEAGLLIISVTDNGEGMSAEDARLSLRRHATSKIKSQADLFRIRSLGFRGEALPSIASVSQLTIETATEGGASGVRLETRAGEVVAETPISRPVGTRVTVENLFYNTPARLKYMRSQQSELSHIIDVINRLGLAHPDIAFTLTNEGRELTKTSGSGQLQQALAGIYGLTTAKKMLAISASDLDFEVSGYVSLPELTRANRHYITLLVNGRYIKNFLLNRAVLDGYGSKLMVGRFPIAVIDIQIDPYLADVNVHPTKQEVRISKEDQLRQLISSAIATALKGQELIPDALDNLKKSRSTSGSAPIQGQLPLKNTSLYYDVKEQDFFLRPATVSESGLDKEVDNQVDRYVDRSESVLDKDESDESTDKPKPSILFAQRPFKELADTNHPHLSQTELKQALQKLEKEEKSTFPELDYFGQMHGTYLFAQGQGGLYIIDQHAAQERVKYEYYREAIGEVDSSQQQLLVPYLFEFPSNDLLLLKERMSHLHEAGILLEEYGPSQLILREHPVWLSEDEVESAVYEMCDMLLLTKEVSIKRYRAELAIMMSCKRSIKANHHLDDYSARDLLVQLSQCDNPYNCPHGRPVLVTFSKSDMEKMFRRIQENHTSLRELGKY